MQAARPYDALVVGARCAGAATAMLRDNIDAIVVHGADGLRGMFAGQDYLLSQLNWAVSGGAPGSTFKLVTASAAIEEARET